MSGKKTLKVTKESPTGRNLEFQKKNGGQKIPLAKMIKQIEAGKHPAYHTVKAGGKKAPRSNPDRRKGNNLG